MKHKLRHERQSKFELFFEQLILFMKQNKQRHGSSKTTVSVAKQNKQPTESFDPIHISIEA